MSMEPAASAEENGPEESPMKASAVPREDLRLSIDVDPCELGPGDTTTLTGGVRTTDREEVELTEPVDYQWSAPDSWRIVGEGNQVQLITPDSHGEADIRLSIEDSSGIQIRGGVPIELSE